MDPPSRGNASLIGSSRERFGALPRSLSGDVLGAMLRAMLVGLESLDFWRK